MPLISLHGVSKRYLGGIAALTDVTFDVDEGEFLFLSGPSGAGKTTLLRLLLRMEVASQGDVLAFGQEALLFGFEGGAVVGQGLALGLRSWCSAARFCWVVWSSLRKA